MTAVLPLQVLVRTGRVVRPHRGEEEQGLDEQVCAQVLADRLSGGVQVRVVQRGEVAVSLAGTGEVALVAAFEGDDLQGREDVVSEWDQAVVLPVDDSGRQDVGQAVVEVAPPQRNRGKEAQRVIERGVRPGVVQVGVLLEDVLGELGAVQPLPQCAGRGLDKVGGLGTQQPGGYLRGSVGDVVGQGAAPRSVMPPPGRGGSGRPATPPRRDVVSYGGSLE